MKKNLCVLTFFLFVNVCYTQSDFIGLINIEHGHTRSSWKETSMRSPTLFNATPLGGTIETYLEKKDGCIEKYRFDWTFDQDISQLDLIQDVTGELIATKLNGNCSGNNAYIVASGSNNGSMMIGKKMKGFKSINISANRASATRNDRNTMATKMIIKKSQKIPEEAFFIIKIVTTTNASSHDAYDYEIRYEYKKNASPAEEDFNCLGLYHLGVNIGMIEYGAHNNDDPTFIAGIVDDAISNIKSIGCISPSYLLDLKHRLLKSKDSFTFYREISNYRQNLHLEINNCKD